METPQDRSSARDGSPSGSQSGPRSGGKLGRIAGHTQGLVEDLREWIDLRLDLAILEMEERVDELRNEIALGLALAFSGFFAALFAFTTAALGLGWLLGHPFWGFLIVTVILGLLVGGLAKARPDLLSPSNLFERLRGRSVASESSAKPVRDGAAAQDAAEPSHAPEA